MRIEETFTGVTVYIPVFLTRQWRVRELRRVTAVRRELRKGIKLRDVGVTEQGAGSTRSGEAQLMSRLTGGTKT